VTLLARIQADVKQAMKAGDSLTRDTLRLAITDLNKRELDLGRELQPDEALAVLQKCVKSREESVAQYTAAGREDLAAKEKAEIGVIQRYLPALLSPDETAALVKAKIQALGLSSKKELGQLMKAVLAEHKGQVDGKLVQRLAAELLD
jgi:uncharacterized protein YqeY